MPNSGPSWKFSTTGAIARGLLAAAAGISFLLLLAVLYLWMRSHFIAEVIYFNPTPAPEEFASPMPGKPGRWQFQWNLASSAGKAQVVRRNIGEKEATATKVMHLRPDDQQAFTILKTQDPLDVDWRLAGVQYFRSDRRYFTQPPVKYWVWGFLVVSVPYWLLALLTAILPAIAARQLVRAVRQRGRIRRGMCPHCGYDLRGGGGVCPECGTKIETIAAALRR